MFHRQQLTDQRPASYASEYDIPPIQTTYAASTIHTAFHSTNRIPPSTNRTHSAVVNRKLRLNGMAFHYSHGSIVMPCPQVPTKGGGEVTSSRFQTLQVQLHDWVINTGLHAAGYPRNLKLATRVSQLETSITGGAGSQAMSQAPIFPRVQQVPRYNVTPATYMTRSRNY